MLKRKLPGPLAAVGDRCPGACRWEREVLPLCSPISSSAETAELASSFWPSDFSSSTYCDDILPNSMTIQCYKVTAATV